MRGKEDLEKRSVVAPSVKAELNTPANFPGNIAESHDFVLRQSYAMLIYL